MNDDKIVVYETFMDPINANIVKGLLDSYGIECFLSDENIVNLNALYSQAVGGVKLNVFEKDIDRISAILRSENIPSETVLPGEVEKSKVVCPNCQSDNVSYGGSVKRKFGYRDILVSFLLMIYPFTM
ncbi:MAG TPA: DUF2007 domain-containing protein, partial [Prolixibacteraceae bacterium]